MDLVHFKISHHDNLPFIRRVLIRFRDIDRVWARVFIVRFMRTIYFKI